MAFDPTQDIRAMLADFGQPVVLANGAVISGIPGLASVQDALGGETIISGRTRTLRLLTADVGDLAEGDLITWSSTLWRVNATHYAAEGYVTQVFLGKP